MKNFEVVINERVIEAINYILTSKIEINKADFAKKLGIKPAKFSEILNKRMKAGMDIIQKLCIDYKISADWIITGKGSMYRDMSGASDADPPMDQSEIIRLLNSKIEDQQKIIGLLEDKIELLQGGSAYGNETASTAAAG